MSIRAKLLLLILFATLIPALVGGLMFRGFRETRIEEARRELAIETRQVARALTDTIRSTAQLHYGLSRARDFDAPGRESCSAFLAAVLKEHPQYTGILTINPDGQLFCDSLRTGRALNLTDRRYFRQATGPGGPLAVEPVFGRLTGVPVLQIAYGVRHGNGAPRFVLLASLNLEKFMQGYAQSLPRNDATIALVDGAGTVLTWHPGGEDLRGTSIAASALHRFAAASRETSVRDGIEFGGVSRIWAASALPGFEDTGLRVLVGVSARDLLAAASAGLDRALATLAVVWLLVFAGALALAELAIRRQAARIVDAVTRFGAGEFGARIGAPYPGGELGELMRALDRAFSLMQSQREVIDRLNTGLEQRVAERTAALEDALGELEAFSYTVSHDLRSPLRHVNSFAQLALGRLGGADAQARRYLEKILPAALHMERLIDAMLELAHAGRVALKSGPIDMGPLVLQAREACMAEAGARRIEWRIGELPVVAGDARLLLQVFVNLLENAVKYTAGTEGAAIEVWSSPAGEGEVCVSVRDNGAGFDMAYADKLFGPFQRLHSDERFDGLGIGLATVRRIVERHGGRVRGEAEPGKGATFHVTLKRPPAG